MQTKKAKNQWAGFRDTTHGGIDWANRSAEDRAKDSAFTEAIVACVREARAGADARREAAA